MSNFKEKDIPLFGQDNNALTWLIIINASIFVLLGFLKVVYSLSEISSELFYSQILNWFTLPTTFNQLIAKPWVVITYCFTHFSTLGFLSNMIWLWCFGYILQDIAGNLKIIPVYIYGGVIGALCFLVANIFIPLSGNHYLLGASASIMAIAIVSTTLLPNYRIFPLIGGGLPLWLLAVIYITLSCFSIGNKESTSICLANIAGGLIGFLYAKLLQNGKDCGSWMIDFWSWLDNLFNPEKKHNDTVQKDRLFYKSDGKPFYKTPNLTTNNLNNILDKINSDGYDALTDDEKKLLKRASKEEF